MPKAPARPERLISLDAARAARREKRGPDPVVEFLGEKYALPGEMPLEAIAAFGAISEGRYGELPTAMEALFPGTWKELVEAGKAAGDPITVDDMTFLLEEAFDAYGLDPESAASS